jgi:hypothetical protein
MLRLNHLFFTSLAVGIVTSQQTVARPANFAQELALARKAGFPTKPSDLRRSLPPASVNAAATWQALTKLLKNKPLSGDDKILDSSKRLGFLRTPEEVKSIEQALKRRSDVVRLIDKGASQSVCVWNRDWSKGDQLLFPELATMRNATRILSARAEVALAQNNFKEAVRLSSLGFRIASHSHSEAMIIGELVAIAIDRISLSNLQHILLVAGDKPNIAKSVVDSISRHYQRRSWKDVVGCEMILQLVMLERVRKSGPSVLGSGAGQSTNAAPMDKQTMNSMVDHSAALLLRFDRELAKGMAQPYPQGKRTVEEASKRVQQDRSPLAALAHLLAPVFEQLPAKAAKIDADVAVTLTAAKLLDERLNGKGFPDRLDSTMARRYIDPYTQKPISYRKEGSGFVVWSVGESGRFMPGPPMDKLSRGESMFRYTGR